MHALYALVQRLGLLLTASVLLVGCAAKAPLPARSPSLTLPQQLLVQRHEGQAQSDWLLVIQDDAGALRFSLFDPLGVPLARQRLLHQEWHSEGLLPPNNAARELFAALLFALTPAEQLQRLYPQAQQGVAERSLMHGKHPRWQVGQGDNGQLSIRLQDGLLYHVTPLHPLNETPR